MDELKLMFAIVLQFLAHFVKEVTYKWMLFFLEIASQESGEVIYQNVDSPLLWAEAPTLQSN